MKVRIAMILFALLCLTITVSAQQAPAATPAHAAQAEPPNASPAKAPATAALSVTLNQLQSRLTELQQIHQQALAQLNALEGAEQEIQRLIQSLTQQPPTHPAK